MESSTVRKRIQKQQYMTVIVIMSVLEEENSCPELIKRALKKKTDLEFDKGLLEDNLLRSDYVHYKAKYHGPPQYLPPYNHSTFLSHQVFLI